MKIMKIHTIITVALATFTLACTSPSNNNNNGAYQQEGEETREQNDNSQREGKQKIARFNDEEPQQQPRSSSQERDPALVGLWCHSEVLGSGEMTFATENFMEFQGNGKVRVWNGAAAGSGYESGSNEKNANVGNWRTSGGSLFLSDPSTGQEVETYYTIVSNGNTLSLKNENSRVLFQRRR